jgi:hypothetical protein
MTQRWRRVGPALIDKAGTKTPYTLSLLFRISVNTHDVSAKVFDYFSHYFQSDVKVYENKARFLSLSFIVKLLCKLNSSPGRRRLVP